MQDQQPMQDQSGQTQPSQPQTPPRSIQASIRRLPLSIVLGLGAVVLAAGSGTAWWVLNSVQSIPISPMPTEQPLIAEPPQTAPQTVTVAPPQTPPAQSAEQTIQVYWLKNTGNQIELVGRSLSFNNASQPDQILTAALEKLLAGPADPDLASTIPSGTALRNVEVKPDGVHVDLSSAFKSGGGSTSMTGRIAQIIYTATTLEPDAKVWISVNGEPLDLLGGEGLVIDQPMTRKGLNENFSL
jgi:spore germination protein GerM